MVWNTLLLPCALLAGETSPHWAYRAPVAAPLPAVRDAAWCRNEMDFFVLARLEAEGLAPAPEADRPTLIRRLSLDLLGLPPSPDEVDAFVGDAQDGAYERLVDRLLASPRYGERMALPWLDLARYADTNGYEKDLPRSLWPWRDWVIRAFNDDLPFDRFTIAQLAGDLLPEPTRDDLVATGFHRNTMLNDEGGIDPEEFRVAAVVDRVSTTATIWLGSTIGCAQCHDHKHDPFTQRDYYGLFAFFDSTEDTGVGNAPSIEVPTIEQEAARTTARARLDAMKAKLRPAADDPEVTEFVAAARERLATPAPELDAALDFHDPLDGDIAEGRVGAATVLEGGAGLPRGRAVTASRDRPISYGAFFAASSSGAILSRIDDANAHRGFDLFLNDGKLEAHIVHHWPDDGIKVESVERVAPPTDSSSPREWHHAFVTYDGSSKAAGVALFLDGRRVPVKIANDSLKGEIDTPVELRLGARNASGGLTGALDDARVYDRALSDAEVVRLALEPLRDRAASPEVLAELFALSAEVSFERRAEIAKLEHEIAGLPIATTLVLRESATPRETRLMKRGDFRNRGEVVQPATPATLHPFDPSWPRNRLGLAQWLVHPANPLLGRTVVNRAFLHFFGEGLVATGEDFGTHGDPPTHPELLDTLAVRFVADGMRLKALHRRIVTSAAYRQSAAVSPLARERDPLNRLFSRGARFRLDGETLRDNALAIGGLLDDRIGGESVMPPQPPGVWKDSFANFDTPQYTWVDATGRDRFRRGIYTYLRRSALYPSALTFDGSRRDVCVVERGRTNTPLQALDVLNDPVFVEAAGGLAQRMQRGCGEPPSGSSVVAASLPLSVSASADARRVDLALRLCLARPPTSFELDRLIDLLARARDRFATDSAAASSLLRATGLTPTESSAATADLAACVVVANVLLNLDETITRS